MSCSSKLCVLLELKWGPQGTSHVASRKSGLVSSCKRHLGISLESLQYSGVSSRVEAGNSGFLSSCGRDLRVPTEFQRDCRCQCGLGLGLGKASPWGFILMGWTLRPTSLCPGAEGGQESRGVGRFADTPGGEFPFPRFPCFPLPASAISSASALCCRADSGVACSSRDWGLLHCGASDTLGVSAKRSLPLCCTCDHMS